MTDLLHIRLRDMAAPDAWLWALGEGQIRYHGQTIDVTRERLDSMAESVEAWTPPILREHDEDGPVIGYVTGARVLTRDEAQAVGIDQEHPAALYLAAEWLDEGRALDESGQVRYSSVGMRLDWEDDRGRVWPAALRELSVVRVPHVKAGQVPRPALAGITLSDMEENMTDDTTEEVVAVEEAEMAEPTLATMLDELYKLAAKLDEITALVSESRDDSRDAEAEMADPAAATMSDRLTKVERENADLRKQLALRDATDAVRTLGESRVVEDADKLVSLRLRDAEAFDIVAASLPERPQPTERKALGGPGEALTFADQCERYAAEHNITFTEARKRLRTQEA
jgi:hypothetical protein